MARQSPCHEPQKGQIRRYKDDAVAGGIKFECTGGELFGLFPREALRFGNRGSALIGKNTTYFTGKLQGIEWLPDHALGS